MSTEMLEHRLAGRFSWGAPLSRKHDAAVSYCTCGLAFMSYDGINGSDALIHKHWDRVSGNAESAPPPTR